MRFTCNNRQLDLRIAHATIAGWTGRDGASVQHHIAELAAIGVAPPSASPLYYRVSALLFTQESRVEVLGPDSSGEVEPLVVRAGNETFLGLGSDQTDRLLEVSSVASSKQICPKAIASELWPFGEVVDHLDDLRIQSEIWHAGQWTPYQDSDFTAFRPLPELIDGAGLERLPIDPGDAAVMLCGTCRILSGGIRPAEKFRMKLIDPVCGRRIEHLYDVHALPVIA